MKELRRKVHLPVLQLSELTTEDDPRALTRIIQQGKGHPALTYHYRLIDDDNNEQDGSYSYNLFPVVLDRNGAPWVFATLYILAQLEAQTNPNMTTHWSSADDLGSYKEWLDTHDDADDVAFNFPKLKLRRPTYRYRGHLLRQVQAGEIALTGAQRRMGTVVRFYRWLINNNYFKPEYSPWEETNFHLGFKTTEGNVMAKNVISTDVKIRAPKSRDPFGGVIEDGEKLKPLTRKEQDWVLEASLAWRSTECFLMQLFVLATGARIQTAGTQRARHFIQLDPQYSRALFGHGQVLKLSAGPGTNIDTKFDKNGVLHVPRNVYELLQVYAQSERAVARRNRFLERYGDHPDPYLFLTQQGNPYFTAKADSSRFNPNLNRRHEKNGQTLRQFVTDRCIPYVHQHYDSVFFYKIHDLRASYGMNATELLMTQVHQGGITLHKARMTVKELLWHDDLAVTDRYLNYRQQMDEMYTALNNYGDHLQTRITQAMQGLEFSDE